MSGSRGTPRLSLPVLEVPAYKFFRDGGGQPQKPKLPITEGDEPVRGANGNERRELQAFAKVLSRLDDRRRNLLMTIGELDGWSESNGHLKVLADDERLECLQIHAFHPPAPAPKVSQTNPLEPAFGIGEFEHYPVGQSRPLP